MIFALSVSYVNFTEASLPSTVTITTSSIVNLNINHLGNQTIEQGTSISYSWSISAPSGVNFQGGTAKNFTLYENNVSIDFKSSNGATSYSYTTSTSLTEGIYNYTIFAGAKLNNGSNAYGSDSVFLTVVASAAPVAIHVPEPSEDFYQGLSLNILNWTFSDYSATTYNLLRNDSILITGGSWISNQSFSYNDLTALAGDTYVYSLEVFDQIGLNTTVNTTVTVLVNPIPTFSSQPGDMQIAKIDLPTRLNWVINDVDPKNYTLYLDGNIIQQANVPLNKSISYQLINIGYGTFNFTLVTYDIIGQVAISENLISITDISSPVINSIPTSKTYPIGSSIDILMWTASDDNPYMYQILRNGTEIASGSWVSNSGISFSPTVNQQVGTFNFTIVFFDESSNSATNTVFITILPVTSDTPNISVSPTVFVNSVDVINGNWTYGLGTIKDATISAKLFQNNNAVETILGSIDSNSQIILNLTYSDVDPGNYTWIITFTKSGYSTQTVTSDVTVFPAQVDYVYNFSPNLVKGENFIVSLRFFYINTNTLDSSSLSFSTLYLKNSPIVNQQVNLVITYIDNNGKVITSQQFHGETNSKGNTTIIMPAELTSNIRTISSFAISMTSVKFSLVSPNISSSLPLVITSSTSSGFSINAKIIITILLLLLVGGLGLWIYSSYVKGKSLTKVESNDKLNQLLSIKMILFANNAGIPLYEGVFSETGTDSTMVAGLSTAISSFVDEFMESKEPGIESIERADMSLLSHRSSGSALIVVSRPKLPPSYQVCLANAHKYVETSLKDVKKYKDNNGNYRELIEEAFRLQGVLLNVLNPFRIDVERFESFNHINNSKLPKIVRDQVEFLRAFGDQEFTIYEFINQLKIATNLTDKQTAEFIFALDELDLIP